MIRFRTLLFICALALPVPAVLAGCGGDGGGGDADPQTVLDDTFDNEQKITSGTISLGLDGSVEGSQSGSFEATLDGPFQTDPDQPTAIPQLDLSGSLGGEAAGQSVSFDGGLVVTDDNAYVEYSGNAYEVGTEVFKQFKQLAEQAAKRQESQADGASFGEAFRRACESSIKQQGGDPSACDIDFQSWLGDLGSEGTEEIDGVETDHITGTVNVDAMLGDLVGLGTSFPEASGSTPSEEEIQQISEAVTDASFDLYSGSDDHLLRGLDFDLGIDPSKLPDDDSGVEGVDLSLTLRLGSVNEPQTIEAPSGARPIDELLGQFGIDPGSLGGLGGGLGDAKGGGGADPDAARKYLDCVEQAGNDADEINKCASAL